MRFCGSQWGFTVTTQLVFNKCGMAQLSFLVHPLLNTSSRDNNMHRICNPDAAAIPRLKCHLRHSITTCYTPTHTPQHWPCHQLWSRSEKLFVVAFFHKETNFQFIAAPHHRKLSSPPACRHIESPPPPSPSGINKNRRGHWWVFAEYTPSVSITFLDIQFTF